MAGCIFPGVIIFFAVIALGITIKLRRKVELPVFLFLMAFEILALLAAGWIFVIHGVMIEMGAG